MKIFNVLFRRSTLPNGDIFRGKVRVTFPVSVKSVQELRNEFEVEEQNMFYLRHSYLTPEQSAGHAKALGKQEESFLKLRSKKKEFKDNITIESQLGHLRHKEAWD